MKFTNEATKNLYDAMSYLKIVASQKSKLSLFSHIVASTAEIVGSKDSKNFISLLELEKVDRPVGNSKIVQAFSSNKQKKSNCDGCLDDVVKQRQNKSITNGLAPLGKSSISIMDISNESYLDKYLSQENINNNKLELVELAKKIGAKADNRMSLENIRASIINEIASK